MLREILLRLPPQPSSLPRASAVCSRWRRLTTDPKFLHRFYAHHRKPPILGFFDRRNQGFAFTPILNRPDRIPTQRFDLRHYSDYDVLGCRHGRVLAMDRWQSELLVCDPITSAACHVAVPPEFTREGLRQRVGSLFSVLLATRPGHVHGGCHSSPFKVVLIRGPPVTNDYRSSGRIIQAEDGAVGFAVLSYPRLQMWQRNVTCHGVATWVLWKTIEMNNIPGLPPQTHEMQALLGYSEDTDEIFMYLDHTVHMVQLKLMQSKRLSLTHFPLTHHPFTSFYTPGTTIRACGCDEADMLHDP